MTEPRDASGATQWPAINRNVIAQETTQVTPHRLAGYHGEDIRIGIVFRTYGRRVELSDAGDYPATATFYYRTATDEAGHWHSAPGSIADGMAWATFGPTMDAGQDAVEWFLRIQVAGASCYKAAGTIRLLPSPGFEPAILPPAHATLDFALLDVLNAPYYTKTETGVLLAPVAARAEAAFTEATEAKDTANSAYGIAEGIAPLVPFDATPENQLADRDWVADTVTQGTAIFRGNYATRAALFTIAWQTSDPTALHYVSNNDYAVVQDDEAKNDECWRYIYVKSGAVSQWTPQYMINERPLTQAQLAALNSGATSANIASIADKLDTSGGTLTGDLFVHDGYVYGHLIGPVDAARLWLGGTELAKVEPADTHEPIRLDFGGSDGGTVAYLSDLPSLSGYATETFVNQQITATVGTINSALDTINGEVI